VVLQQGFERGVLPYCSVQCHGVCSMLEQSLHHLEVVIECCACKCIAALCLVRMVIHHTSDLQFPANHPFKHEGGPQHRPGWTAAEGLLSSLTNLLLLQRTTERQPAITATATIKQAISKCSNKASSSVIESDATAVRDGRRNFHTVPSSSRLRSPKLRISTCARRWRFWRTHADISPVRNA